MAKLHMLGLTAYGLSWMPTGVVVVASTPIYAS